MKTVTAELLPNGNLHVSVPLSVKQTGGVTRIIVPGEEAADPGRQAFLLAVARGRRWQQLIDAGKVENIKAWRRSSGVTSAMWPASSACPCWRRKSSGGSSTANA